MNRYTEETLQIFRSPNNKGHLFQYLIRRFPEPQIVSKVQRSFEDLLSHFHDKIYRDYLTIENAQDNYGVPPEKQTDCLNKQFLQYASNFLQSDSDNSKITQYGDRLPASAVTCAKREVNGGYKTAQNMEDIQDCDLKCIVRDGKDMSEPYTKTFQTGYFRRGMINEFVRTRIDFRGDDADKYLESWRYAPSRPQYRDDNRAAFGSHNPEAEAAAGKPCFKPPGAPMGRDCQPEVNIKESFYDGSEQVSTTGEVNPSQSDSGSELESSSRHVDMLMDSPLHRALNSGRLWVSGEDFVDEHDPKTAQRYYNRRVFRAYGPDVNKGAGPANCVPYGDEAWNQIPSWVWGKQHRYYERDVDEALSGDERGTIQRGFDRRALTCRLERVPPPPADPRKYHTGGSPGKNERNPLTHASQPCYSVGEFSFQLD